MTSTRPFLGEASVLRLPPHVRLRHDAARERWVVLAPERLFVPDAIALEILRRCDGRSTVAAIVDELCPRFDAPRAEIAGDVVRLLQDLADKGVVVT